MSERHFGTSSKMTTIESVCVYVSAEYSSFGSAIALYTSLFVMTKLPCCNHTRFHSPPKAPEAC